MSRRFLVKFSDCEYREMNWLYIVTMLYIVLSGLRGYHKGFLKVVYSMAGFLIAVLCIAFTVPPFGHALRKNKTVYHWIKARCQDKMMAEFCIYALSFFIVLFAVIFILWRIGRMLDLFTKTPGIHLVNMIFGFFAGIVKAFLVIWTWFTFIKITSFLPVSAELIEKISEDAVLQSLYEQNRVYEILKDLLQFTSVQNFM